jgi:DNA polymerase-3 subunit gamma/tau
MSSARAAINAALEAARAASRPGAAGVRRAPPAPDAGTAPAAVPSAPAPASTPAAAPGPQAAAAPARTTGTAPWDASGAAASGVATSGTTASPSAPIRAQAQAVAQPQQPMARMQQPAQAPSREPAGDDEPPSWVTEFSDDTAVASHAASQVAEAPALAPPPARVAASGSAPYPYVVTPVAALDWDGNWPALAASLQQLRGVSQQLAFQTELVECVADGAAATFRLRVPVDTLRASGNSEKLCAALQERFPSVRVNVDTEIAPVWYTASAEAKARRERLQREAEAIVDADPFVQAMAQTFDAFVVAGSVRPIAT